MRLRLACYFIAFALLSTLLAACSNPTATPSPDSPSIDGPCLDPDLFCIGVVTDNGPIDDGSFNAAAWAGAQAAAEQLGGQADFAESAGRADYAENIGGFGGAGYDVVVTIGFSIGPATLDAARAYPDTDFIGMDQTPEESLGNYVGLLFPEDQSGFLAGALAAMMSQSGAIGGVFGSASIPPVVAFHDGYQAGAHEIDPDIEVISTYYSAGLATAFNDPEWGAETARSAIDAGADVIFAAAGETGQGALIEAARQGVYCIGVDTDQWLTVPDAQPCLLSSAQKLITPAVTELALLSDAGAFPGGVFYGAVGLAPFHDFEDVIPQDVKDRLAEIEMGLADGTLSTGSTP